MKKDSDIEKFLANQDFIQWVKNPNLELDVYWQKWIQSHPEDKEAIGLAKEILSSAKFREEEPSANDYDIVLNKILSDKRFNKQPASSFNWKLAYRIAATLLLLVALTFVFYELALERETTVVAEINQVKLLQKINPTGQKSNFILPDGSKVWLNAQSSVSFPEKFNDSTRLIQLKGEAYFEVVENEKVPFVVQTGPVFTRALGTSFNVNYFDSTSLSVSLVTGKVLVSQENNQMVLNPGEKITYLQSKNSMIKADFNYKQEISWIDGVIYFENADFEEIVEVLERWYGVDIKVDGWVKSNWSYNGSFDNQSLEIVLKRLSFIKGFDFKIVDRSVTIKFQ